MRLETMNDMDSSTREDPTLPRLSDAERSLLEKASFLDASDARLRCPNCQQRYRPGELACPHCGILLAAGVSTTKLGGETERPPSPKSLPVGAVFVEEQKPIIFEIDGVTMVLPVAHTLIIGRLSELPGDPRPDVNLNAFEATERGVSRQHARIVRKRELIYISDLGSSNGTFLNGRPLAGNYERILRNGDELRLGHLKIKVRF
jgi:FHA domain-containing protein